MTYLGPRIYGNFKQPVNPNKKRVPLRDKLAGNSKTHLALIRKLPSCVSGRRPCDPHHLHVDRGMGLRARDKWCVPLTRDEHDHLHSVGSKNELAWFKKHGIENPYELAKALWKASGDLGAMAKIVEAHLS